jgi:hypothetical protein
MQNWKLDIDKQNTNSKKKKFVFKEGMGERSDRL